MDTVQWFNKELVDCCILQVEVGTTGPCGGDTGHGGRTYLRLIDRGGCDLEVHWIPSISGRKGSTEIRLGGDAELRVFIKALKFAVKKLEAVTETTKEAGRYLK